MQVCGVCVYGAFVCGVCEFVVCGGVYVCGECVGVCVWVYMCVCV